MGYTCRNAKHTAANIKILGSGVLSGEILLVKIVENNEIGAYFRAGEYKS